MYADTALGVADGGTMKLAASSDGGGRARGAGSWL
jgi:hypothetical protein